MNKNKELAKNTTIITIGKVCTQLMSFLLLPFYTALLSKEQYGAVDLVTTYVQLLLPIVILQIDQAVFRYLIEKRKNEDGIIQLISSVLAFTIFQFFVFTMIYAVVLIWFKSDYRWYLYLNVLAAGLSGVFLQIARGIGDNSGYAIASFLAGFFNVLLNVIFIAALGMRAEGMMLATFLANIICTVYILLKDKVYKYFRLSGIKKETIKEMLGYAFPLIPNSLSWWVVNASDRSIIRVFIGTSANGILAASHKFSSIFTSFYSIFNISWTESASLHLTEDDRDEFFSNIIDIVYRLFMSCCIGIIACMPFVFPVMINKNFADAYYQIPIYMIAAIFNVVSGLYSVVYIANKKTSEIAKTSIAAGVINIIVDLALVKFWGLYAASVSSAVAYGIMAIYRHFDVKRFLKPHINVSVVLSSLSLLAVVVAAYYVQNTLAQVGVLVIAVFYAVIVNLNLIQSVFNIAIKVLKGKGKN